MNTVCQELRQLPFIKQFDETLQSAFEGTLPTTWEYYLNIIDYEDGVYTWGTNPIQSYASRTNDFTVMSRCSNYTGFFEVTCEVLAYYLLHRKEGQALDIRLNNIHSKDANTVQPLWVLVTLLEDNLVRLTLDYSDVSDLSYQTMVYLSRALKTNQDFPVDVKRERFDLKVGQVYTLFTRASLSSSTSLGRISDVTTVRVDKITDEGVLLQPIPITHTLEEDVLDFIDIPAELREGFRDMLDSTDLPAKRFLSYWDFGWQFMFGRENYILMPVGVFTDTVQCFITEGNDFSLKTLTEVDALYYMLKQRGIEFDEDFVLSFGDLKPEDTTWYKAGKPIGIPNDLKHHYWKVANFG